MKLKERIKNNKVLYFLSVLIIGLVLVLLVRIAYAYLTADIREGMSGNIDLTSDVVDEFKFIEGEPLKIDATSTTLGEGGNNLVSVSKPKVTLKANSTNNSARKEYYVYLNIPENTFIYTTQNSTPEILLTVVGPNGNEITSITGLNYGTTYGVSGFDITTHSGLITIADGYVIESNSSTEVTTQEWTITLTYLNLTSDQSANYGKSINTETRLQKERYITP